MQLQKNSYRLWSRPVPHSLDDLAGNRTDVEVARACTERLLAVASNSLDRVIEDALLITVGIRYCRCFASGIRQKLLIDYLTSATNDEIAVHKRIQGVRDWHIAHPVNLQEVHAVHLIINNDPNSNEPLLGMSAFQVASKALDVAELKLTHSLCSKWLNFLDNEIKNEVHRLTPYALQLSRKTLFDLPEVDPLPNSNISARRKQKLI